jgi:hypothetical protein
MATVFPDLLENEQHNGHIPDTPPGSASRENPPMHTRWGNFGWRGREAGILLAGRLLKILIKLGLIFNIKFNPLRLKVPKLAINYSNLKHSSDIDGGGKQRPEEG